MNSTRSLSASLVLLLAGSVTGCASLYDVNIGGVSASYWAPQLSGDVSADLAGVVGTQVDVEDVLDLEDERIPELRAYLSLGSLTLEGTYFGVEYEGQNQLDQTITFQGQTFPTGTTLDSSLELDYGVIKAKLGLIGGGPIAIGLIVGAGYVKLEDDLVSPTVPVSGEDLETPFPVVGGVVTVDQGVTENLRVFGEVEAYGLAVDDTFDIDGHFVDAQARAGVGFGPLKIGGGYRIMDVKLEETNNDDTSFNLRLAGPYVFGEVCF